MTKTSIRKRPTGVPGLDAACHGGLPASGATLITGTPGTGKTVLALQIVANTVQNGGAGIVVTFEESPDRMLRHASSFAFAEHLHDPERVLAIDARPRDATTAGGTFDLEGLLAVLADARQRMSAGWIVLDGLDQLLILHEDRREVLARLKRLDAWADGSDVSLLITAKQEPEDPEIAAALRGTEHRLSTVLKLGAALVERRLNRYFRVVKYRGSSHAADELPMMLTGDGVVLPYGPADPAATVDVADRDSLPAVSDDRVGTGVPRLDDVLGGGPYRGTTTLISGAPGTSKTTLAASFAAAAAARGERALYVSFDELAAGVIRNAASVGIDLGTPIRDGRLRVRSRTAWSGLVEEHFLAIAHELSEYAPSLLVIDPVSALLKAASAESAYLSVERLLAIARSRNVTTVLTSLGANENPENEATLSHTSTLADTWISLAYKVQGGERNRALSVVKSRGTAHSNQVRELILSDQGIELADVYPFGTEVLFGTARLQKEREQEAALRGESAAHERRRSELEERLDHAAARRAEAQREEDRIRTALERERTAASAEDRDRGAHASRVQARRTPDGGRRRSDGEGADR